MDAKIKKRLDGFLGAMAIEQLIDLSMLQMILYDRPLKCLRSDFEEWAQESGYQVDWLEAIESYAVRFPVAGRARPNAESLVPAARSGRQLPRPVLGSMLTCI